MGRVLLPEAIWLARETPPHWGTRAKNREAGGGARCVGLSSCCRTSRSRSDYSVIGFLIESECSLPTFLHNATQPEALQWEGPEKAWGARTKRQCWFTKDGESNSTAGKSRIHTHIYIYSIHFIIQMCIVCSSVYIFQRGICLFMFLKTVAIRVRSGRLHSGSGRILRNGGLTWQAAIANFARLLCGFSDEKHNQVRMLPGGQCRASGVNGSNINQYNVNSRGCNTLCWSLAVGPTSVCQKQMAVGSDSPSSIGIKRMSRTCSVTLLASFTCMMRDTSSGLCWTCQCSSSRPWQASALIWRGWKRRQVLQHNSHSEWGEKPEWQKMCPGGTSNPPRSGLAFWCVHGEAEGGRMPRHDSEFGTQVSWHLSFDVLYH